MWGLSFVVAACLIMRMAKGHFGIGQQRIYVMKKKVLRITWILKWFLIWIFRLAIILGHFRCSQSRKDRLETTASHTMTLYIYLCINGSDAHSFRSFRSCARRSSRSTSIRIYKFITLLSISHSEKRYTWIHRPEGNAVQINIYCFIRSIQIFSARRSSHTRTLHAI